MKNFIFSISFYLFSTTIVYSQWQTVRNAGGNSAIDAIDANCAVFIEDYNSFHPGIYRTLDGGTTWENISPPDYSIGTRGVDIDMIDSLAIWYCDRKGQILHTSDGGKNWKIQFYEPALSDYMNYIEMFDKFNGIAMGDAISPSNYARVLKTSDGGETWLLANYSEIGGWSGDNWRRIDFVNPNTGYFFTSGLNPQQLYKTTNQCVNWTPVEKPISHVEVLKFNDSNLGFIYSQNNLSKTSDGGNSWETTKVGSGGWGLDIEISQINPSIVMLAGTNFLSMSTDTGNTWKQLNSQENNFYDFRDVVITSDSAVWVLGYYATFKSDIKSLIGYTKVNSIREKNKIDFELKQNYPNPFNPNTTISYFLEKGGYIEFEVYNILGQSIYSLKNELQGIGLHHINFNGTDFPSGVYFYVLRSNGLQQTKMMHLVK